MGVQGYAEPLDLPRPARVCGHSGGIAPGPKPAAVARLRPRLRRTPGLRSLGRQQGAVVGAMGTEAADAKGKEVEGPVGVVSAARGGRCARSEGEDSLAIIPRQRRDEFSGFAFIRTP